MTATESAPRRSRTVMFAAIGVGVVMLLLVVLLITRKNAEGTLTYKVPVTTQIYPGDIIYVRERWF